MRLTPITGRGQPGAPYRAPPVCRSIGVHSRYYPGTNRYCAGNGILLCWRLSPRFPRPMGQQHVSLRTPAETFVQLAQRVCYPVVLRSGLESADACLGSAVAASSHCYDRSNHLVIGRWPQRRLRLSAKLPHSIVPLNLRVFIPRIGSQATTPAGAGTKIQRRILVPTSA